MREREREREGEGNGKGREGKEREGKGWMLCIAAMQRGLRVQKRMMHEEKDDEMHVAGGGE